MRPPRGLVSDPITSPVSDDLVQGLIYEEASANPFDGLVFGTLGLNHSLAFYGGHAGTNYVDQDPTPDAWKWGPQHATTPGLDGETQPADIDPAGGRTDRNIYWKSVSGGGPAPSAATYNGRSVVQYGKCTGSAYRSEHSVQYALNPNDNTWRYRLTPGQWYAYALPVTFRLWNDSAVEQTDFDGMNGGAHFFQIHNGNTNQGSNSVTLQISGETANQSQMVLALEPASGPTVYHNLLGGTTKAVPQQRYNVVMAFQYALTANNDKIQIWVDDDKKIDWTGVDHIIEDGAGDRIFTKQGCYWTSNAGPNGWEFLTYIDLLDYGAFSDDSGSEDPITAAREWLKGNRPA